MSLGSVILGDELYLPLRASCAVARSTSFRSAALNSERKTSSGVLGITGFGFLGLSFFLSGFMLSPLRLHANFGNVNTWG